jgi:hypothetical protein
MAVSGVRRSFAVIESKSRRRASALAALGRQFQETSQYEDFLRKM